MILLFKLANVFKKQCLTGLYSAEFYHVKAFKNRSYNKL